MDADGHIIPITEDDQGEGFKDVFDFLPKRAKTLADKEMTMGVEERLAEIQDQLDQIFRYLSRVFGEHILLNGKFTDLKDLR